MPSLRALVARLASRQPALHDFDAELETHLALHTEEGIRSGLSPAEARRQAILRLGGIEQTRQAYRDRQTLPWIDTLLRDVRYALRGFRRNPIFTYTVIATHALGIGSATAVFSVVDRIHIRPLPYAHANRLVSVGMVHSLEHQEFLMGRSYVEWQNNQTPFSSFAAQSTMVHNCDLVENNPAQLGCITFQSGFLPLLGIFPVLGRNFLPEEDRPNGPHVVMISYALWKGHFDSDPHILDRAINLDGSPARVVGVLPKDFQFPTLESADIVTPFAFNPAIQQTVNGGFGDPLRLFARLKPGVSVAQAYAQLQPLFKSDLKWFPPEPRKNFGSAFGHCVIARPRMCVRLHGFSPDLFSQS